MSDIYVRKHNTIERQGKKYPTTEVHFPMKNGSIGIVDVRSYALVKDKNSDFYRIDFSKDPTTLYNVRFHDGNVQRSMMMTSDQIQDESVSLLSNTEILEWKERHRLLSGTNDKQPDKANDESIMRIEVPKDHIRKTQVRKHGYTLPLYEIAIPITDDKKSFFRFYVANVPEVIKGDKSKFSVKLGAPDMERSVGISDGKTEKFSVMSNADISDAVHAYDLRERAKSLKSVWANAEKTAKSVLTSHLQSVILSRKDYDKVKCNPSMRNAFLTDDAAYVNPVFDTTDMKNVSMPARMPGDVPKPKREGAVNPLSIVDRSEGRNQTPQFNEDRGLHVWDKGGHRITRTYSGGAYTASFSDYAFSDKEAKLLESGDYIICSDVCVDGKTDSFKVQSYICQLEESDNGIGARVVSTPISLMDDRFADPKHNERYAMHQSEYDLRIANLKLAHEMDAKRDVLRKLVDDNSSVFAEDSGPDEPTEKTSKKRGKGAEQPTRFMRGYHQSGTVTRNSLSRVRDTYYHLRQIPATKSGKKLGFETMYDEKRFRDAVRYTSWKMNDLQNRLESAAKYGLGDLKGAAAMYRSFSSTHEVLYREYEQRMTAPSEAGALKGYKSAWEEGVVHDYDELMAKGFQKDDHAKSVVWRKMRLDETLEARRNGFDSVKAKAANESKTAEDRIRNFGILYEDSDVRDVSIPDFV